MKKQRNNHTKQIKVEYQVRPHLFNNQQVNSILFGYEPSLFNGGSEHRHR